MRLAVVDDDRMLLDGMRSWLAQAPRLHLARTAATVDELLTEQERRILALIAEGMTNRQIGQTLFLAEKTVKNYVTSVLSKLGLERRTQAAVLGSKLFDK